jgi:hypothetical protein
MPDSAVVPRHPAGTGAVPRLLVDALIRRLPAEGLDAVVLAAAGTRNAAARATVEWAADALSARLGIPCAVGYASAASPLPGGAVDLLRAAGARRVGVAAYFLAPGFLYDLAVRSAREAGAVAVAGPLTDAPELVRLVAARVDEVVGRADEVVSRADDEVVSRVAVVVGRAGGVAAHGSAAA